MCGISGFKVIKSKKVDYLSNTIIRTFPHGLDIEIFDCKSKGNHVESDNIRSY